METKKFSGKDFSMGKKSSGVRQRENVFGVEFFYTEEEDLELSETRGAFCYQDVFYMRKDFLGEQEEKLAEGKRRMKKFGTVDGEICLFRGNQWGKVLLVFQKIPTFDSGDREWGSYRELLLFREKGQLNGIFMRGGYRISYAEFWGNIKVEDEEMQEYLKRL